MSRSAIAFLAGLGTGYLNQSAKNKELERQARLDAQNTELQDAKMTEIRQAQSARDALVAAGAPVNSDGNMTSLDISGKPVLYEDAGVANSDYRQARSLAEQQGTRVQSTDIPASGNPPPAPSFTAPRPVFAQNGIVAPDQAAAKASFNTAANTPQARIDRIVNALYANGNPTGAMQLENSVRQGKLADIQLTQAEQAQKYDSAFREITDKFSRQGWSSVPEIYKSYNDGNTATVAQDGKGGAVVSLFNAKGEPAGQKAFASEMDFITGAVANLDPRLWVGMKEKQAENVQKAALNDANIAEKTAQAGYYNSFGRLKDALAENGGGTAGKAPMVERMSEIDKVTLGNINRQSDAIYSAITKGLADGSFDETSPGAMTLRSQLAALGLKQRALIEKYNGSAPANDPLGIRKTAQPAQTVPGSARQGQLDILNQELAKAQANLAQAGLTPEQRVRAQSDVNDVLKELSNLGVKPAASSAPATAAKPAPATKPVPKPAPEAAPAAPKDAPAADPVAMAAKLDVENREMGFGKRMQYSPEVKAFVDQKAREKAAADELASQAYRAREFKRAVLATRGIN